MKKKILVVAGGAWQCSIVKKAKALGLHVICSNPSANSPAFEFADDYALADVLDKETNLEIAKKYSPDSIITDQSDIAVRTVAWLNEQLGLKGIGSEIAQRFSNKYVMRSFCKSHNLPTPDFALCETMEQAITFFNIHKKIIIKPLDSQSSRGVFLITSKTQLEKLFHKSMEHSICSKAVLAEEYIDGIEFTVDGIKTEVAHCSLAVSEKKHYANYPNVASLLYFSQTNPLFDYDLLCNINDQLVETMELPFGLTHAEYKFAKGRFYLIEIAARGGGTNISSTIVPFMSGIDSNRLLIEMSLGKDVGKTAKQITDNRCCCLEFFDFKEGVVKGLAGEDFLKKEPDVLEYQFNFKPEEKIPSPSDDSRRSGHFIAAASSPEELELLRKKIHSSVFVIYK